MTINRAHARYAKALAAYRKAHQSLSDDRNQKSGDLYEAQQALNAAVEERLTAEYAATWAERWPA